MIRDPNIVKRALFARSCLDSAEDFEDWIFTDKTSIEGNTHKHQYLILNLL